MEPTIAAYERLIKEEGVKRYFAKLLSLTVVYVAAAKLGLALAFNFTQITTIWPATGIAMVALLLWGYHYWPAIFVGAFVANSLIGVPPHIALGISTGNTIEAVVAILLIRRYIPETGILERMSSIMRFVVLGPFLSSTIAASIGVATLVLGKIIPLARAGEAWLVWWVGDMMGALIIVPLVVAWQSHEYREQLNTHVYEALALLLAVVTISLIIFTQAPSTSAVTSALVYIIFPLIILASVRFMQIGAITAGTIIGLAAIWGTLSHRGPYAAVGPLEQNLFVMHFFLSVVIVTGLVLSVAVYGHLRSERAISKKSAQLEHARQQLLKNAAVRQELQSQMQDATTKINEILTGIFEADKSHKPSDRIER